MTASIPRAVALSLCLVTSHGWALAARVAPEFLPGLASDGEKPFAAMVLARDGALYGSTNEGGAENHGTLYRVLPGATAHVSTIYAFDKETYSPQAPMVAAADGKLYGVTSVWKKLYRLTPGAAPEVTLYPFAIANPNQGDDTLVAASDGSLYGTIAGDQSGGGGIYRVTPGAKPRVDQVWTFKNGACSIKNKHTGGAGGRGAGSEGRPKVESCRISHLPLVAAGDGKLYGAASGAGADRQSGFFYRVIPGQHAHAEILFTYTASLPTSLVAGKDGTLYGTRAADARNRLGTVFAITPGAKPVLNTVLVIKSPEFDNATLGVAAANGSIYGISRAQANDCGRAFALTPGAAPQMTVLLPFPPAGKDDAECTYNGSTATLTAGRDGVLFGTLASVNPYADEAPGGVFRIDTGARAPTGGTRPFSRALGYAPVAPMTLGPDGNLYGTTTKGGSHGNGTVFRLAPGAVLKTLFSFDARTRVAPGAALATGADGHLYGAERDCCGTEGLAFKVHTGDRPHVTSFHSFESGNSGGGPNDALVAGHDGYLYGLTQAGGKSHEGSIYRVKPGSPASASAFFEFNKASGTKPSSPLIRAPDGRLYGTTEEGGAFGMGTIFMVTPGADKPVSVLFSSSDDTGPAHRLVLGADHLLYGATRQSKNGCGIIYRLAPGAPGKVEKLFTFDRRSCWRHSELVAAADGTLYIATLGNGSDDDGKIFKITTGDKPTVAAVGSFSSGNQFGDVTLLGGADGNVYGLAFGDDDSGKLFQIGPRIATLLTFDKQLRPSFLVPAKDGYLYGSAREGGRHGLGALLRYKPGSRGFELLYSFSGKDDGASPSTALVMHSDGYFYGMTTQASMRSNGRASLGRVYRFRPPAD